MLDKLKGKYIFFDLDGVLSEYRYNDKINGGNDWGGQTFEEIFFGNVFVSNRPLQTMVELVEKLDSDKVYVLGAITTNHEIDEKYVWLKNYYPTIKRENVIFVADASLKLVAINEYAKKYNMKKEDIVFVDDNHATLREVEAAGIKSYHITSFIR